MHNKHSSFKDNRFPSSTLIKMLKAKEITWLKWLATDVYGFVPNGNKSKKDTWVTTLATVILNAWQDTYPAPNGSITWVKPSNKYHALSINIDDYLF